MASVPTHRQDRVNTFSLSVAQLSGGPVGLTEDLTCCSDLKKDFGRIQIEMRIRDQCGGVGWRSARRLARQLAGLHPWAAASSLWSVRPAGKTFRREVSRRLCEAKSGPRVGKRFLLAISDKNQSELVDSVSYDANMPSEAAIAAVAPPTESR